MSRLRSSLLLSLVLLGVQTILAVHASDIDAHAASRHCAVCDFLHVADDATLETDPVPGCVVVPAAPAFPGTRTSACPAALPARAIRAPPPA